jgi:GT2 family glycosyltransferase
MDLSIVIVCYKGWDRLSRCLKSLDSFSGNRFSNEVIIVDNNSGDDGFIKLAERFKKFRFIRNTINGGFANGSNLGASFASGDYLLFLNPDTVVTENEVAKLISGTGSDASFYIVSCRQVTEDGKDSKSTGSFPGLFRVRKNPVSATGKQEAVEKVLFPDWVSGSVMMMRKDIFRDLLGFDEDFWMYSEDVDICRRACDSGGKVAFFSDIVLEHNHGGSSRINLRTTSITKCEVQISKHIYISKHKTGTEKILMHSLLIADNLFTGLLTAAAGLILFFVPKLFVRLPLFFNLAGYYCRVAFRRSWISARSVNFGKSVKRISNDARKI